MNDISGQINIKQSFQIKGCFINLFKVKQKVKKLN